MKKLLILKLTFGTPLLNLIFKLILKRPVDLYTSRSSLNVFTATYFFTANFKETKI